MNKTEMEKLLQEDPEYISLKRFDFSISNLLVRYEDGSPDHVAASALLLTEEQFLEEYEKIVLKLKDLIGNVD